MSDRNSFDEKLQEGGVSLQKLDKRVFEIETSIKTYIKAAYWVLGTIAPIAVVIFAIFGITQYNLKSDIELLEKRATVLQQTIDSSNQKINNFDAQVTEKIKPLNDHTNTKLEEIDKHITAKQEDFNKYVTTKQNEFNTVVQSYENVRTIVTKTYIDNSTNGVCPAGTKAAHVPLSYRGKTGEEICAANARDEKSCQTVTYIYVTNNNGSGLYSPYNKSCKEIIDYPWPWGRSYPAPNTLESEWSHGDTWVVCCRL